MDLLTSETRKVWIPNHPTEGYVPGKVEETRDDGKLIVVDDEGGQFQIPAADALSVDPAALRGVDDLLCLGDFNEAAMLHNIRVRYSEDKIYTGIGSPILISVNPYQRIPGLYGPERQKEYRQTGAAVAQGAQISVPVHLYTVADAAYQTMLHERVNQSIIISGESGAGKTEATKHVLAYLAEMQRSAFSGSGSGDKRTVEQQVLDANPVLEAFGNAKTVRNDNSSRFGKFVEVEFDPAGRLQSAQISNYLLEKCRIVTQQNDERNYHIFYQLCAGASTVLPELAGLMKLQSSQDYEYTLVCDSIDGVDDHQEFSEVVDCMTSLGFSKEEVESALRIVAAVLHLGNLEFTGCQRNGQDGVEVKDKSQAAIVCELLGVETEQLLGVLNHRTFEDPLTKKTILRPHDMLSASFTRHSMAKVAYARLFDWLVWRINESISGQGKPKKDLHRIGILDIYGFEVFEENSYEQLCINFANEKLQQHFNTHMFTLEQKMYSAEGIQWSHISFQDNQPVIDALEKKPLGLFCLVDSECLMPSATDTTLLGKIHSTFKASKHIFKPSKFASTEFAVAHFAGEVIYNVETFLEKNTDKLHTDIVNLMRTSSLELVKRLFTDPRFSGDAQKGGADKSALDRTQKGRRRSANEIDQRRERTNVTVSMMFREQLDKLVEDLNKTNPRYIRCIKPNSHKTPGEFNSIDVLRQLRCAGMLESIRIRRAGYAVRRPFKEFFTRFRILAPHLVAVGTDPDYRGLCQKLLAEAEKILRNKGVTLEDKIWQLGTARLFMREELEKHFERLLADSAKHRVITIQTRWRGYAQRARYRAMRGATIQMQAALRALVASVKHQCELRKVKASTMIQALMRSRALRLEVLRKRGAAVSIQKVARGWRCRSRIGKVRSKAAADKVRKLREEQERWEALEQARVEAREKASAMEAMRQQLDDTHKRDMEAYQQNFEETQKRQLEDMRQENERLVEKLRAAEEVAQKNAAAKAMPTVSDQVLEQAKLEARKEADRVNELMSKVASLQGDLEKANNDRQNAQRQLNESRSQGQQLGLASAFDSARPSILEGRLSMAEGGRKTIMNQREAFERLKQQFQEAQGMSEPHLEDEDEFPIGAGSDGQNQHLEDEIRRLRRENAALKTTMLSAQEEMNERAHEAINLLDQVSHLEAELQDLKYTKQSEVSDLRQQLADATNALRQQTEDMSRLSSRAMDAENFSESYQSQVMRAENEAKMYKEQLSQLEKDWVNLDQQFSVMKHERTDAQSRLDEVSGQLSACREQASFVEQDSQKDIDQLRQDLRARDNELVSVKRILDDVMNTHTPTDEFQKWKAKADMYEQQYYQAMKYNKEMTSAVGHMTQAASERGGDWNDMVQRSTQLQKEKDAKTQALKMAELEKQDLQKQLENLQSSCTYFQNKYKATAAELKRLSGQQASAALPQPSLQMRQNDMEELKKKESAWRQKINDARAQEQEQIQKLAMVGESMRSLLSLHSEQMQVYEQVCGGIRDANAKQFLQDKQQKTYAVIQRLRSILGDMSDSSMQPVHGQPPHAFSSALQPAGALQAMETQMLGSAEAGNPAMYGRASLLTQLNVNQRGVR